MFETAFMSNNANTAMITMALYCGTALIVSLNSERHCNLVLSTEKIIAEIQTIIPTTTFISRHIRSPIASPNNAGLLHIAEITPFSPSANALFFLATIA